MPLRRELATLEAWITGLRREQAPTREGIEREHSFKKGRYVDHILYGILAREYFEQRR